VGFPIPVLFSGIIRSSRQKTRGGISKAARLRSQVVQRLPHKVRHFTGAGHLDLVGMLPDSHRLPFLFNRCRQ
jgi:hypothetical protein